MLLKIKKNVTDVLLKIGCFDTDEFCWERQLCIYIILSCRAVTLGGANISAPFVASFNGRASE